MEKIHASLNVVMEYLQLVNVTMETQLVVMVAILCAISKQDIHAQGLHQYASQFAEMERE